MPLYKGREFIERLSKGNEPYVRRLKKGPDELTYGLYDIRYFDGQPATNDYSDHLKSQQEYKKLYAWGKNRWLPTLPEDPGEYEYLTHNFGWYNKPDYSLKQTYKDDRPMIDYREHINLDLYAKWRQKRFEWEGVIGYWTGGYREGEGSISGEPSSGGWSMPSSGGTWAEMMDFWSGTPDKNSWDGYYYAGQCTDWVKRRIIKMGQDIGISVNVGTWAAKHWEGRLHNEPKAGAIACWWGNTTDKDGTPVWQHVAVVEEVTASGTVITSNGNYGGSHNLTTLNDGRNTWSPCYVFSDSIVIKNGISTNCWGTGDSVLRGYYYTDLCDHVSGTPVDKPIIEEEPEMVSVYETMEIPRQPVEDQKHPSIPDMYEFLPDDAEDPSWESLTSYTMERTTVYDEEGYAEWSSWEDKYVEDGENFHLEWEDY